MRRVLTITAHPDDVELMMAGTFIRMKQAGWEAHYFNVGHGGLGTNRYTVEEAGRIRREEAKDACRLIGAVHHPSVEEDLGMFYTPEQVAKVAAVVREVAPEVILTHYPFDYMEDHSNVSRMAVTAAFTRSMINFVSHPERPVTDQPVALYHAMPYGLTDPLRRPVTPHFYVDISEVIDLKTEMLACHRSQKEWLDVSQGHDSYLIAMREMMQEIGRQCGRCEYAEGWIRHLHLGLGDPDFDPLAEFAVRN